MKEKMSSTVRYSLAVTCAVILTSTRASAQDQVDDFRGLARSAPPAEVKPPAPGEEAPPPKPKWELSPFGYLRAGYDYTMEDPRFDFIGRNNGFVLDAARLGLDGRIHASSLLDFAFRTSIEGAADVLTAPNTPQGTLSVRLRDAFGRWSPSDWFGIQVGQFKAPFQEEELRGNNNLAFASRAVGIQGVLPGRGIQTAGIQLDRQVGVMLSPSKPIGGDFGVSYYFMLMNGAGSNQLLNDNNSIGLVGRSELNYLDYVRLGAALVHNERTVGNPPNQYDEQDFGLTADLAVNVVGLQVFGSVTRMRTVFPTVGTEARVQLAYHGQVAYRFDVTPDFFLAPAYRYAHFHPWQEGGADGFGAFALNYHTFGVRAGLTKIPIQAWLNYTVAGEGSGRQLDNDRLELVGQVSF